MAFATVEDLKLRWPDMPPGAEATAEARLSDASTVLQQIVPDIGAVDREALRYVVIQMVVRSMQAGDMPAGAESVMTTAGPYSQQLKLSNPNGDLYLTKLERKLLGIGGAGTHGAVDLLAGRATNYGRHL